MMRAINLPAVAFSLWVSAISTAVCSKQNSDFIDRYVENNIYDNPKAVVDFLLRLSSYRNLHPRAAYILGSLYLEGKFLPKNIKLADIFVTMAANAGLPEAMNSLGDAYYSGDIREKNIDKALTWYEKAAKLGYGPAQFNAGIVLLRRTSNKRDLRQAIYYFDKAYHNKSNFKELAIMALRYKVEAIEKQKGTKNTRN